MQRVSPAEVSFEIVVNGAPRAIVPGTSVAALLAAHGLDPDLVVVERNGRILRRDDFDATELGSGDILEIVHFVGGG